MLTHKKLPAGTILKTRSNRQFKKIKITQLMTTMPAMSAGMPFTMLMLMLMIVIVALSFRIVAELAFCERCCSYIRASRNAAVKLDTCLGKSTLCAAAYTAADKHIDILRSQKSCKRAMTVPICSDHFLINYLSILSIIDLKLLRMTKVLKNISVFVSYCYSHDMFSFRRQLARNSVYCRRCIIFPDSPAVFPAARRSASVTYTIAPARYNKRLSINQTVRDLFPRRLIYLCHSSARYVHLPCALLVRQLFQIYYPDRFILVKRKRHLFTTRISRRVKSVISRLITYPPQSAWSSHIRASFSDICRKYYNPAQSKNQPTCII